MTNKYLNYYRSKPEDYFELTRVEVREGKEVLLESGGHMYPSYPMYISITTKDQTRGVKLVGSIIKPEENSPKQLVRGIVKTCMKGKHMFLRNDKYMSLEVEGQRIYSHIFKELAEYNKIMMTISN